MFSPIGIFSGYSVGAAYFDGTNDYLRKSSGLTGAADSKVGLTSFWVRLVGGNAVTQRIFCSTDILGGGSANTQFRVARLNSNLFSVIGADAGGTIGTLQMFSSSTYLASTTWLHVLAAWNVETAVRQMYINDVSNLGTQASNNVLTDFTGADTGIGGNPDGTNKLNAYLAELYFALEYMDISVEANRRKFISAAGKPVNLGSNGSRPTGSQPIMYHRLRKGEDPINFAINRGYGGNFSIIGALELAPESPSS